MNKAQSLSPGNLQSGSCSMLCGIVVDVCACTNGEQRTEAFFLARVFKDIFPGNMTPGMCLGEQLGVLWAKAEMYSE